MKSEETLFRACVTRRYKLIERLTRTVSKLQRSGKACAFLLVFGFGSLEKGEKNSMKLWLCSQSENTGYDTYDSMVVAAETEDQAREQSPSDYYVWHDHHWWFRRSDGSEVRESGPTSWADPKDVAVVCIGNALPDVKPGVIVASFNAG